jgi:MYXO-CTERM domain-containing protein
MRYTSLTAATILGALLLRADPLPATPLFTVSGRVDTQGQALPAGVTAKLGVDLDRDGQFAQYEQLTGTVDAGGNYQLTYDLDPSKLSLQETVKFATFVGQVLQGFGSRGFDYLLDQGPLPVVLSFEREGYSTIVRRLNTMLANPTLDVVMRPLQGVGCTATGCQSGSGNLVVSKFPGGTGIARAFAEAYDPSRDTSRFPGGFVEQAGSLLISSGYMEVDFRDQAGTRVKSVSSPVDVRFEANPTSWSTLRDLKPGTTGIEVPMWSFDDKSAQWVAESDGQLLDVTGTRIPEASLAAIQSGSYSGQAFVGFSTTHFSTWNCDHPVSQHTCVKGRLLSASDRSPVVGATVSAPGVSYTGSSGSMTTGADGYFVADVMKSEVAGEDVDGNGKTGETFTVRISVSGALGAYEGSGFATSVDNKVIGSFGSPRCRPADCDCPSLGDVVAAFESPRLCQVTLHATFSGKNAGGQSGGPLTAGDPMANAEIHARLSGNDVPPAAAASVCAGKSCNTGTADAQGNVTILVPVLGDAPQIEIDSNVSVTDQSQSHYYTARAIVVGCTRSEAALGTTVELGYSHASLSGMAAFIASLGPGPGDAGLASTADQLKDAAKGCGCRMAAPESGRANRAAFVILGLAVAAVRRRRPRRSRG